MDSFLKHCNLEPIHSGKIIKKHIWRAAGHKRARQFEHWQAQSQKATAKDDDVFRRLLEMAPPAFVGLLRKKDLL